jgi:DNA-binding NarL/FixJ family response regulator
MNPTQRPNRARILLADDHKLVAEACKRVLEPEFEVVGMVTDGRALLRATRELRPQVIVADISMPVLNGLDAGEQVLKEQPEVRIVYVTMNLQRDLAIEAFRRGAAGYVLKAAAATELLTAIREVLLGRRFISPQISASSVKEFLRFAPNAPPRLSMRQREVVQLLAEGKVMKEVADILNVATRTVAFHKYRIMALLGVKTNAELVQYAIRHCIVQSGSGPE